VRTTSRLGHPGLVEFQTCHLDLPGRIGKACRNLLLHKYLSTRYTHTIQVECCHKAACCGFSTMRSRKRMERILRTVVAGVSSSAITIPGCNGLRCLPISLPGASLKPVLSALPTRSHCLSNRSSRYLTLIGQTMR